MSDKKVTAVLQMLAEQIGYSFKVVKKYQLFESLPQSTNIDYNTFVDIVAFLKNNEFLSVKYQDKNEICLSLTVKAENYLSGDVAVKSKLGGGQVWLLFLGVFVASLLGAIIGTLLMKLI